MKSSLSGLSSALTSGCIELRSPAGRTVKLAAMGDLDFHDPIAGRFPSMGSGYLFAKVAERLARVDVRIANLETVIVRTPRNLQRGRACLVAPLDALDAILGARIDVLTFSNNHVLDMGGEGLLECLAHVRAAGLKTAGSGNNLTAARRPAIVERKGIKVIVFAYSYGCGQIAGRWKAGCAEARLEAILEDVASVREQLGVRIVCLHMDGEFQPTPSPSRVAICRSLADAGVDLVLCHHPHVAQGIEIRGKTIIAYSLGNYITPISPYMLARSGECHLSFHLEIECDTAGVTSLEVVPVLINDLGRPELAVEPMRSQILAMISERSMLVANGSEIRKRYESMIRGWCVEVAQLFYWSVGKGDWFTCRRLLVDLLTTPTKRQWIYDCLVAQVRRWSPLRRLM